MDEKSKLERDFAKTRQRYNEARRDRASYKEYLDSFLQYKNRGIIGEEQRLSWIEELETINKRLKLSTLRYEINPQDSAEIVGLKLPNGIKVNSSNMKLTAGALHEGDVLYMLLEMRKKAKGNFAVKSCDLTSRIDQQEGLHYQPKESYVNMVCNLEWYTIEVQS
ncbi:MAG: hypothetical protein JXA04_05665 [Gammaproteobacteria bacterium]|nr:hypothetical protein [Gammaproteobacteria bacterium]